MPVRQGPSILEGVDLVRVVYAGCPQIVPKLRLADPERPIRRVLVKSCSKHAMYCSFAALIFALKDMCWDGPPAVNVQENDDADDEQAPSAGELKAPCAFDVRTAREICDWLMIQFTALPPQTSSSSQCLSA